MSKKRISPSQLSRRVVRITSAFKKDLKKGKAHVKCDLAEPRFVMLCIENRDVLDAKYLDHFLEGRYPGQKGGHTDCRECHVGNDWLLVYRFPDDDSVDFIRMGTHSELF